MAVKLQGRFDVKAAPDEVYAFLTDPRKVSPHMPDVEEVNIEDADHFTVKARVGIPHLKGTMVMKLTITDRQPPVSTTVVGKGSGLGSVVDMVTGFKLEASAEGGTIVNWQGEMTIAGKIAALGAQGLLDRMARKNVETFIEGIKNGIRDPGSGVRDPGGREP
jgi:carbon monoxide dehydrogenase subunit G